MSKKIEIKPLRKRSLYVSHVGRDWRVAARNYNDSMETMLAMRHRKSDCVDVARKIGRLMVSGKWDSVELFIFKMNGQIQRRHTYGRDPVESKG